MEQETKEQQQERLANLAYRTSGEYDELNLYEKFAIDDFFNQDKSSMIAIILDESLELSKNFRRFIVDVLDGKSCRQGRPKKFQSDLEIYQEFIEQLELGKTQKSIATEIAEKVGKKRGGVTPEAIIKSYKRMKPIMEEYDQLQADMWREEQENER